MHRTGRTGDPVDERVDYFLLATSWSGEPRIIEADKCADLRWFDLHDLPTPVVPHELQVIEGLRDGTLAPTVKIDLDGATSAVDYSYGDGGLGGWADIPANLAVNPGGKLQ